MLDLLFVGLFIAGIVFDFCLVLLDWLFGLFWIVCLIACSLC